MTPCQAPLPSSIARGATGRQVGAGRQDDEQYRQQVVVQDDPVGRMRPRETIDPAPVRLGPRHGPDSAGPGEAEGCRGGAGRGPAPLPRLASAAAPPSAEPPDAAPPASARPAGRSSSASPACAAPVAARTPGSWTRPCSSGRLQGIAARPGFVTAGDRTRRGSFQFPGIVNAESGGRIEHGIRGKLNSRSGHREHSSVA